MTGRRTTARRSPSSRVLVVALLALVAALVGCRAAPAAPGRTSTPGAAGATSGAEPSGASSGAAPAGPSATGTPAPGTTSVGHLAWDGRDRTYLLHVPARRTTPTALVVSLHGSLGSGAGQERLSGYDQAADGAGFLVAYPDGVARSWADGRGAGPADRLGVDDVGFLAALVADLVRREGVDPRWVFVSGMSNGAFMAQRLACERPALVAAVAPVAGTYGEGLPCPARSGAPARPVSVLEVHGTDDPLVPYAGGSMTGRGGTSWIEGARTSFARWSAAAGCAPEPAPRAGPDGTAVEVLAARGCRAGAAVELWTVTGGGHTWPGGPQYLPARVVGRTTDAFSAAAVTWAFFAAHHR